LSKHFNLGPIIKSLGLAACILASGCTKQDSLLLEDDLNYNGTGAITNLENTSPKYFVRDETDLSFLIGRFHPHSKDNYLEVRYDVDKDGIKDLAFYAGSSNDGAMYYVIHSSALTPEARAKYLEMLRSSNWHEQPENLRKVLPYPVIFNRAIESFDGI
jgi:hypothetical protein